MSSTTAETVEARRGAVTRAAVVVNHRFDVRDAMAVLDRSAAAAGVELVDADADADLVLALGGDGTMLGALRARLGTETPVFGFNFGHMGFLTSAPGSELESVLPRVFAGEFTFVELATLEARLDDGRGRKGRQRRRRHERARRPHGGAPLEIEGEHLGDQQCDGMICATPAGSTAYNLSNGGPVMMWGIDAMAITFVAPHSLEARPVVVPRGYELRVENLTRDGDVSVIVDGRGLLPSRTRGTRSRSGSARSEAASRTSPRSASSRATTTSSGSRQGAAFAPHRELRPDPRGRARARAGAERRHGGDGRGKDDPGAGARAPPRCQGRRRLRRVPARRRHTSRPSSTCPEGVLEEEELATLRELRPEDEESLVAARRVFADGRTRAYAWGRSVAREDLAHLDRPAACHVRPVRAAPPRTLLVPARPPRLLCGRRPAPPPDRARARLARARNGPAATGRARRSRRRPRAAGSPSSESSWRAPRGSTPKQRNGSSPSASGSATRPTSRPRQQTRRRRSRRRAGTAPRNSAARAGRELQGVSALAPELAAVADELADAEVRLREAASTLRGFLDALDADPGRVDVLEADLERISDAKRRFRVGDFAELLAAAAAARNELEGVDAGDRPPRRSGSTPGRSGGAGARPRGGALAGSGRSGAAVRRGGRRCPRRARDGGRATSGWTSLRGSPAPQAPTTSLSSSVRTPGLPFAPVAETASGGELSRIALALRTVSHAGAGEPTIVFDEIDAGIGGRTAHAVADALRDLAGRAQVVTITHLPQIASAADAHFRVEKVPGDPTHTRIERLGDAERKDELERMLGGAEFLSGLR